MTKKSVTVKLICLVTIRRAFVFPKKRMSITVTGIILNLRTQLSKINVKWVKNMRNLKRIMYRLKIWLFKIFVVFQNSVAITKTVIRKCNLSILTCAQKYIIYHMF